MRTKQNLKEAFAGESQANRRYLAFAERAEQEGFDQVGKLFRAVAHAETIHALAHLRVMGAVRSTAENIREAISGEHFEHNEMYPGFMTAAMHDGEKAAMLSFSNAMEVEKVHHSLYIEALEKVEAGQDLPERTMYVCNVCGNTIADEPPVKCPVCGSGADGFKETK
jgi:rubrerythrin